MPARQIFLLSSAASAFFFSLAFTTSALYRFQMVGLDPLQLVLMGTALELSVFLFEIPTGIVADIYSRRTSVIIGYALIGAGLFLEGSLQIFATMILAQAIWGAGYTFISGAKDAWLADEVGEAQLPEIYLRSSQLARVGAFVGIGANVALAQIALNVPLMAGGLGQMGVALMLLLFMRETNFRPAEHGQRTTLQKMIHTFSEGLSEVRKRPLLVTILAITLIYGLYSEALDRLWEAHILSSFSFPDVAGMDTVTWFGLFNAVLMLIGLSATELIRRRTGNLDHGRMVRLLAFLSAIMVAGLIAFGLAPSLFFALVAYGSVEVARSTSRPLFGAWVNRGIPSTVRATVLSSFGQMDALGQIAGGPIVGAIANRVSIRAAIVSAGVILSPVLILYRRAARQGEQVSPVEVA